MYDPILMGEITHEQFLASCTEFVSLSAAVDDGWKFVDDKNYQWIELSKEIRVKLKLEDDESELIENPIHDSYDIDAVTTSEITSYELISCKYEVHYSPSYCVPVLYARLWQKSGQLISLEEIWRLFSLTESSRGWDKVGPSAHPVTGLPWIQIHPCKSADLATIMRTRARCNYLVSYLSFYGQAVGLKLSPKYACND